MSHTVNSSSNNQVQVENINQGSSEEENVGLDPVSVTAYLEEIATVNLLRIPSKIIPIDDEHIPSDTFAINFFKKMPKLFKNARLCF